MEDNKQKMNSSNGLPRHGGGPWWKPGMQILSEVSTWIVVPILCAAFLGKTLDTHFGTKPTIFLVSMGVGFLFTCYGMWHSVKNYMNTLKEINSDLQKDKEQKGEEVEKII